MLSRRLLVNHRIYDHVDEEPKHHVHEEELKKNQILIMEDKGITSSYLFQLL